MSNNRRTYHLSQLHHWAQSAWEHLQLDPPVDLRIVSNKLHVDVERRMMPQEIMGIYARTAGGYAAAAINSSMDNARQRWTWAHELAHHLLYHDLPGEIKIELRHDRKHPLERQCDRFACELLMPANEVIQAAEDLGYPENDGKFWTLCDRFGVSPTAMRYRLKELGYTKWRQR